MQTIICDNRIKSFPPLQSVIIGMGFSKKASAIKLLQTLNKFLQEHQYQATVIALPAFKQNDLNVHEFKKLTSTPTYLISTKILIDLQPKCSHFSEASYRHTGLGAVAEACVLALMNKNDRLLIPKIIYNKITISVAVKG